jgi:flagella basal body P-ring formation protein FlgA
MIRATLLALAATGCLSLDPSSDRVTAGDLARAWPALAVISAGTPVGYAPAPGIDRVYTPAELRRVGLRLGVEDAPETAVCIRIPTAPPDPARWIEAMRKSMPEARIELLEYSRYPVPAGEAVFPRSALQLSGRWNGYVGYAGSRRFPVWTRVRARVENSRVVAAESLPAGRVIAAEQIHLEQVELPPGSPMFATSLEEVVGRVPRRTVAAGSPVLKLALTDAPAVKRGETVKVEVRQGGARLELEAQAESDGRPGERIAVRNPATQKRFVARVEGKGRAVAGETGEGR